MDEQWRDVVGLEGQYEVSSLGNVRSVDRTIVTSNGHRREYEGHDITAFAANRGGYPQVQLKGKNHRVQDLVTRAFLGPRQPSKITRHRNRDKTDNRLENLYYAKRRKTN
jgi:hypothetical protein